MNLNSPIKITGKRKIIWERDTALKILLSFFDSPTEELYERQVAGKAKLSPAAVNKYIRTLAEEGFLKLSKRGNMSFYSLERENPVVKRLKTAYSLSRPVAGSLAGIARKLGIRIYVYGSVARGEDTEESDWDILAIGDAKLSEIEGELNKVRKQFNGRLRLMAFSTSEWIKMEKNDRAFYERVEKDKIGLM